jgi:isocitrate dehydrogenase
VLSNRGQKVWPNGSAETFTVDVTRARFQNSDGSPFGRKSVIELLTNADNAGVEFVKTEGLFTFDGERGFSLAQGQ